MFADVITCETDMSRAGKQLMFENCMIRREIVRKVHESYEQSFNHVKKECIRANRSCTPILWDFFSFKPGLTEVFWDFF